MTGKGAGLPYCAPGRLGYHPCDGPDGMGEAPMEPPETIEVEEAAIACDGGGGALGHPRVWLHLDSEGRVDCPYCGRRFVLKDGAGLRPAH